MVRLRLAVVCALGALLLMPEAAAGGGWWSYIDVNPSRVAPGQRVELDEEVGFSSAAAAQEAQQTDRFRVYLLRGFDYSVVERAMREPSPGNWWSLGGAEAIEVAPVAVRVSDGNLASASAAFTVPELPPATYHLMLCDAACREPLADVIPAEGFTVVADPATARLESRNAGSKVDQLEASMPSRATVGRSQLRAPWTYAGWVLVGALAGAGLSRAARASARRPSARRRPAGRPRP